MSIQNAKIDWQNWSAEALAQAEREGKPILLAITATWCHWCHVMDRTTFENEEVVRIINEQFIPIQADNDRRPDLNTRYNMGGWPTVALLTPKGDILTGATYIPPGQMIDLLNRVQEIYNQERDELVLRAEAMRISQQEELERETQATVILNDNISANVMRSIEGTFDPMYGGFGGQQKFPHVPVLEFLFSSYRRTGNLSHLEMAVQTLDSMRQGGIYDPVEGGFFRYSTTRDWSIPHYEKMLEDNSGLLAVYILAYNVTGDESYLEVAREISSYLENTLMAVPEGAFFGSQDAVEEYYQLDKEEREKRTPPSVDKTIYTNWNAMAADAYLKAYEATGDTSFKKTGLGVLEYIINSCRKNDGFYHYCDPLPHEPSMLTDQVWAGTAFLRAYECTGSRRYLDAAREAADHIISSYQDPNGGFYDITEDRRMNERLPNREKLLDENANVARFLNRLSYYSHEASYRKSAELALRSLARVYDAYGILAAPYALAVSEFLSEPVRIAVAGSMDDPRTQSLLESSLQAKSPSSIVETLGEDVSEEELQELGLESTDPPQASVCAREICRSTGDPDQLWKAIHEFEKWSETQKGE